MSSESSPARRVLGWFSTVLLLLLAGAAAEGARLDGADFLATAITPDSFDQQRGFTGTGSALAQTPRPLRDSFLGEVGATAFVDETNTTRTFAAANAVGTYSGEVRWTGFYTKDTFGLESFRYTVNPSELLLTDFGGDQGPLRARWEIIVRIDGVFRSGARVEIAGRGGTTQTETFEVVEATGFGRTAGSYVEERSGDTVRSARYTTLGITVGVPLPEEIGLGDPFEIQYVMISEAQGVGGETYAMARIGDPFGATGGVTFGVVPEPAVALLVVAGLIGAYPRRGLRHP